MNVLNSNTTNFIQLELRWKGGRADSAADRAMQMTIFALKLIIPGAFLAIGGVAAMFTADFFDVGWRCAFGGVGLVGVGIYILVRNREPAPEAVPGPAIISENGQINPSENPYK